MEINLISDTVTRPTPAMLEAMMSAKVGDDVFGDDPTVNELQAKVAGHFGVEAALFFPSGTMANQTAIKLHTQPGDQLICDTFAHVYNFEGGGASFNSGVSCRLVPGQRGMMSVSQVQGAINPSDIHSPPTRLVCIENTTNKGGGACWDFGALESIGELCRERGLHYHLDGARLWNALVHKGEDPKAYGGLFDTISVCFSKGLGCPVGSALLGPAQTIQRALRVRKILGGGMRQAGFLAAAAIHAMDHHIERLAEDHVHAREIGEVLGGLGFIHKVEPIETNIIIFELDTQAMPESTFLALLAENRVSISNMGQGKLRMVTHLDYSPGMHRHFLKLLRALG